MNDLLRHLVKFSFLLLFCAGLSYFLHAYIYSYLYPDASFGFINFAYKFNFGITFIFTTSIILASQRLKEQLGFLFMASGFVKLAIFLYLSKTADFEIDKSAFLHFFIPYVVCVILEILYVIKILNGANFNKKK